MVLAVSESRSSPACKAQDQATASKTDVGPLLTFCQDMKKLSLPLKTAISNFLIDLQGGLIDDERWSWDVEKSDWKRYRECFLDPTILRTTIAVWMNTIELDEAGNVTNEVDAAFRAFQYFRHMFDHEYRTSEGAPTFEPWEIEEPY